MNLSCVKVASAPPLAYASGLFPILVLRRRATEIGWQRHPVSPAFGKGHQAIEMLAPRAGFEPATNRLTAGCSTTELPGNRPKQLGPCPITKRPGFGQRQKPGRGMGAWAPPLRHCLGVVACRLGHVRSRRPNLTP